MKFLIITNTPHKINADKVYAYGPYITEMNVWIKNVEKVRVLSFKSDESINKIELAYEHKDIEFVQIPSFNLTTVANIFKTIYVLPYIVFLIAKNMMWAKHIHLRSPSNMALLGLLVQIFFPWKKKTVKYAANWDRSSEQASSYRLQQNIMESTLLSKNLKALVYGKWPNQTKNIVSFFTATYYDNEKETIVAKEIKEEINIIFSGRLVEGKRPLLSIQVVEDLIKKGYNIHMDIVGDGDERERLEEYISLNKLEKNITMHGRQNAQTLKILYKKAHFLVFMSKTEGWGKVITEAMFWGCLPITTDVGPISYILGEGRRGTLVEPKVEVISQCVIDYINNPDTYKQSVSNAVKWSQNLTLDSFNTEIQRLLND